MKKIITYSFLAFILTGSVLLLTAVSPMGDSNSTGDQPSNHNAFTENEIAPSVAIEASGLSSYKLEEDSHNFGEVKMGSTAKHTFWFTNTGTENIVIQKVKPSCSCTASNFSTEPVAPGEKGYVEVVYPAKKAGVFRKTATITANTDPANKILTISGEVVN